jgi:asparagine synthase (glutamine-hydrolysing)
MGELHFPGNRPVTLLDPLDSLTREGRAGDDPRHYVLGWMDGDGLAGEGGFADRFGRFVVLVHRGRDGVLEVHNDRWGALPLYYAVTERGVFLATRAKALVEAGAVFPDLDLDALAEAMAFDVPLRDHTLLAGMRSLEGGMRLVIDLTGRRPVEARRLWNPAAALHADRVSFGDAKAQLLAAFLEGVERATDGSGAVSVTLSGGMDSRCLLAAALHLGRSVRSYHMSEPGGRADRYARKMAEMYGVPHAAYAAGPELAREYYQRLRMSVARHEGMSFEPETEVSWLRDQVPAASVMLHGGYAELSKLGDLRRFYLTDRVRRTPVASLAGVLWPRWESTFAIRLRAFAPELRDDLRERARVAFERRLADIAVADKRLVPEEIVQICYLQEQVKVEKFSGHMWNQRLPTRFPFSYPRYVDLLLRVRSDDRMRQTFQIHVLHEIAPRLYRVPDANTGVRVDAPRALQLLVRGVSKIRRDVLKSRSVGEHADVRGWMGAVVPPPAEVLLHDLDDRLYDPAGVRALVAEAGKSWRIGEAFQALLILELWREWMGLREPLPA